MDEWLKGEFGKPFGSQPKLNPVRAICYAHLPKIWNLMWRIVDDESNPESLSTRGTLLKFMMEQAGGRAPKSMEVKATDGLNPNMMSTEQIKLMAAGKIKELVFSVIQSGQIDEYIREHREGLEARNMDVSKASRRNVKQLEQKNP
jgi:hypothetical protein